MLLRTCIAVAVSLALVGARAQLPLAEPFEAVYSSLKITALPDRVPTVGPLAKWVPTRLDPGATDRYRAVLTDPLLRYGPTSITADQIEVDTDTQTLVARGSVFVEDPIGVLHATEMLYHYKTAEGRALGVYGNAQGAYLRAEELELRRGEWSAMRGEITTCSEVPAHYSVQFDRVSIRPGSRARAYKARLSISGVPVVQLAWLSVPLDRRTNQLTAPTIGYNSRQGWALAWRNEFRVSQRSSLLAETGTFQRALPEWRGILSYSLLDPRTAAAIGTPDTEEGERFTGSYIDNVSVESPESEEARLRAPRFVLFFENSTNLPVSARREPDVIISKNWELGTQWSIERGPIFGSVALRYGQLTEKPEVQKVSRGTMQGVIAGSPLRIAPNTSLRFRLDGGLYDYDGQDQYGWIRPAGVLVLEPDPRLRLGFSYLRTFEAGNSLLELDRPRELRALHGRMDLMLGKTSFSFLAKYDLDRNDLYDIEFAFRQTVHCVEPHIVWRRDPGVFRIGVRIPTVDLLGNLIRNRFR